MKKIKVLATIAFLATSFCSSTVLAAENPTCVLMKFTDDTRFDRVESAASLSDLVMEKLLSTGKFNFKETKVINEDMEKMLYDERAEEFANARWSAYYGNFTPLFEGPGFNENKAQSIATANLGQIVSPGITRQIGAMHGADYLIQGTIVNIGSGNWWNRKVQDVLTTANSTASMLGSTAASNFLGPFGMIAGMVNIKEGGIGIRADLRLIKASNGKVIWEKQVTGFNSSKEIGIGLIKIGSDKLNSDMYYKAMEDTAEKISIALVEDFDAGKMFVE